MYILGDIGNTETKLCLVSKNNKILKKIIFLSKSASNNQLNILFNLILFFLNKLLSCLMVTDFDKKVIFFEILLFLETIHNFVSVLPISPRIYII